MTDQIQSAESVAMENLQQPKAPLLVSKREAAALLGVCVRTIDCYIAQKELTCRHFGKRILIPYSALQSFARRDHPAVEFRRTYRAAAYQPGGAPKPDASGDQVTTAGGAGEVPPATAAADLPGVDGR